MKRFWIIVLPLFLGACSVIDDDLSVCDEELMMTYQVQLHTNLAVQLLTDLSAETDSMVRGSLESWLAPIFTDRAKDIDLRFFSTEKDEIRHQIQEVINDNRTSYTFRLLKDNYMHLAVANIVDNRQVLLSADDHSETMMLRLKDTRDLTPLTTGIYTARLPMVVTDTTRRFDVRMYMITSAVAIVIDTTTCKSLVGLSGYVSGSARGFHLRDSAFIYDNECRFSMEQVAVKGTKESIGERRMVKGEKSEVISSAQPYDCYATVCLPTRDSVAWNVTMVAELTSGRRTTTTLTINEPLKAGTLRVLVFSMDEKGGLDPDKEHNAEVGATVELDWNEGTEHEIEL